MSSKRRAWSRRERGAAWTRRWPGAAFALLAGAESASAQTAQRDIVEALENTEERIDVVTAKLIELGDKALELLPILGVALVVIIVFWLIARLVTWGDLLFRWIDNALVRDMVRQVTRVIIVGAGILIALELLNATALVGAALGTAGVAGIALGFAFRDIAENYLAGILLSVRQPFAPNDLVSIDGEEGKVIRLTARATVLLTLAGNHLRIPNARVFKAVLLNYTRNPLRRLDFEVGVGVDEDLVRAQTIGRDVLSEMDAVIPEPPPLALIEKLADSSVVIHLSAWFDQRTTDYFKARSEAIRVVKAAYDDAGIEMPEPIYRVYTKEAAKRTGEPETRPAAEQLEAGDTAADDRLDVQVESERAAEGPDLLDEDAPHE